MPGRPSAAMLQTMELVRSGMTPYKAAKTVGINLGTMYRSVLYRAWKAERDAQVKSTRLATVGIANPTEHRD